MTGVKPKTNHPKKNPRNNGTESQLRERIMPSRILGLLWLTATLSMTAASVDGAAATSPTALPKAAAGGVSVNPTTGLVTTEAGGTATFTVVLKSPPVADVTIAMSSSDGSEGTVGPAVLTFTAGNWNTPQTVTVTGVDDSLCDHNVAYTILTAAARSADAGYNNRDPANVTVTNSDNDCANPAAGAPGGIRISITNEYEANLNFGPLGKGSRTGKDRVEGVLKRQGSEYVGTVDAFVESTQGVSGLGMSCGPARYEDSQKLKVIGHPENGFNPLVQSVDSATMTGQASAEFLRLEFTPETMTSQQPGLRRPEDMLPDLVVNCHTLIDTLSGIAFLPLNDSRWTMEGGGYIIVIPTSGVLEYTDNTVAAGGGETIGPFQAKKSIWTIRVERLR
jgi:hypothetical protein